MIEIVKRGARREDRRRKFYCTRCDSDWIADEADYLIHEHVYYDSFNQSLSKKNYLTMPCPICGYSAMLEEFLGSGYSLDNE